jgi:hypothetical protein
VRVYRRKHGKNELIATAKSRGDGTWSAEAPMGRGEYVAKVGEFFKDRYGLCAKARSRVVRIRGHD